MYICYNYEIIKGERIKISPMNKGLLYGHGLFETIKVLNSKMFFYEEHMERMEAGCRLINLDFNIDVATLEKTCHNLIVKNNIEKGSIRITIIKSEPENIILITTAQNKYSDGDYIKGFKVCISNIKRNPYSPLVRVKSNNYLENILAREEAIKAGFKEAVFLNNDDIICEGTISNIFFVKDNQIFTPSIECGLLPGIIRKKVIEICENLNKDISIGKFVREDLFRADEIFITNSLLDIMPVSMLESKEFNLQDNKTTRLLMKELVKLYKK